MDDDFSVDYGPDKAVFASNGCVAVYSRLRVADIHFTVLSTLKLILLLFLDDFLF